MYTSHLACEESAYTICDIELVHIPHIRVRYWFKIGDTIVPISRAKGNLTSNNPLMYLIRLTVSSN